MKEHVPSRSTFIERTIKSCGSYFLTRPFQVDEIAGRPSTVRFHQAVGETGAGGCMFITVRGLEIAGFALDQILITH
ncbi:hypothetical protein BHE74_00030534 [Ensete ventricosum]|nr:hypothetical protein BHE74_00030534 [Ensete ventricosum]RZS08117.1 hypothetical protein BHM03_00039051 [Ensete ventricosum]